MAEYVKAQTFIDQQTVKLRDARSRLHAIDVTLDNIRDAAQDVRRGSARWLWLRSKYYVWKGRRRKVAALVRRFTYGPDGVRPTEHFSWLEVADSRTREIPRSRSHRANLTKALRGAEQLRAAVARQFGVSAKVVITSGVRTPYTNQQAGGASRSYHTEFATIPFSALDVAVWVGGRWLSSAAVEAVAIRNVPMFADGGIGLYDTWTHLDHGPKRRWDRRS